MAKEKGFLFFDTSYNQEEVINKIFKQIEKENAKRIRKTETLNAWVEEEK